MRRGTGRPPRRLIVARRDQSFPCEETTEGASRPAPHCAPIHQESGLCQHNYRPLLEELEGSGWGTVQRDPQAATRRTRRAIARSRRRSLGEFPQARAGILADEKTQGEKQCLATASR